MADTNFVFGTTAITSAWAQDVNNFVYRGVIPSGGGGAFFASPNFTGNATAINLAISGLITVPTAAAGTNNTVVASTAFVQNAVNIKGSNAPVTALGGTSNIVLTNSVAGGLVFLNPGSSIQVTVPTVSTVLFGQQITFFAETSMGTTISVVPTTGDALVVGGFGVQPLLMGPGDSLVLEAVAAHQWAVIGGSVQLQYASTALNLAATNAPVYPQVRQTVETAAVNSTGQANYIQTGTGLSPLMQATAVPVVVNYATGSTDVRSTLYTDTSFPPVPANANSFLYSNYGGSSNITLSSTLAPPQYGYSYNSSLASLVHFDGTSGSTSVIDDNGNTWTAVSGAKLQTNQVKLGTAALGGAGTLNALNGTSDYVGSNILNLNTQGGWAMRAYAYITSLAGPNYIFGGANSILYGVSLVVTAAGKCGVYMSSTGSSNDIAAGTTGTATVSANTWNYFEITKDPIAQKYYVYVNGVLDQTISSVANICTFAGATYGVTVGSGPATGTRNFATGYIDEFEYKSYCDHPAGTAYTPPVSANVIGTAGYASDFISPAQGITVYSVTGPSAVAGQNPPMIAINRVYHGECNASNTTIASAISYALNGGYDSGLFSIALNTTYSKNHNIGTYSYNVTYTYADDAFGTNERAISPEYYGGSTFRYQGASARNGTNITTGASAVGLGISGASNTGGYFRMRVRRSF